jgi:predicted alternative tryptophan synthase beta-subunit
MNKKIDPSESKNSAGDAVPVPEMFQAIEKTIRKAIKEKEADRVKVMVFVFNDKGVLGMETYHSCLRGQDKKDTDQGRNFSFGVAC